MLNIHYQLNVSAGYIAGADDGIVTVAGKPAEREIWVLNAHDLSVAQKVVSLKNGHYLITGLSPDGDYLILCRDHERVYEPAVWDFVRPATDLTLDEQQALWQSWQS